MQDYWNDPPDNQEPPEWYMTLDDILEQQNPPDSVANAIRKAMDEWVQEYNAQHDIEPIDFNDEKIEFDLPDHCECPHGKEWANCDACDHASDIAFDAAMEQRFSR